MAAPPTTQFVAYDVVQKGFQPFPDEQAWLNQLTIEGVKDYLSLHLKASLMGEISVAIKAFGATSGSGFFSLLRSLFPFITFLGSLYKGKDEPANAVAFMKEYLGTRRGDKRYVCLSALLYAMYRHGLTHTHSGKVFRRSKDNLVVGWGITYSPNEHLTVSPSSIGKNLLICPECLYQHLLEAIDIYIMDFDDSSKQQDLKSEFQKGFLTMAKIYEASRAGKALESDIAKALDSI